MKATKKKTHSLTVLMLKSHIENESQAIKTTESIAPLDVPIGTVSGKLYFKQSPSHPPSWTKLFEPKLGNALTSLYTSGSAAVLIVKVDTRFFALTFGYGRFLLLPDCYEENFGLRVVLNSVNPKKLRSVDAQSLDAIPLSRRSQASIATGIADFGLDIEQDIVYAATGQPEDSFLGKQLTGKDALKIGLPIEADDIPLILERLASQYESTAYKQNFGWVDHLSEIRQKALTDNLDLALVEKIQAQKNFDKTWLAIPEIIDWSDIAGFRYQKRKKGDPLSDIGWMSYLEHLDSATPLSIEILRKHSVHAFSESSGQCIHIWPVYRCIYCELSHDGADYTLNNGKWYKVDTDFLQNLNASIAKIPGCSLVLPEFHGNDEANYNKSVHENDPTYFALMDKNLISHGGGHSKIEFCDLYTTERHLIHVKRYGGSSVLSHLFSQGEVSARLLLSDSDFRKKVNALLPTYHKLASTDEKPKAEEFEVVYAIACNSKTTSSELPLFSKINLRNSFNQLQTYGMKCSLAFVQVI